ncbi:sarcosine oxidase subunit gamma [Spinactinospora alkalitolerans]|uniref:Sarcosine oxidase subunit gamma n=1 Tax=Spinactinospora alkalitolerans TaxID=687207 RepID=A0A852TT65_9ACTN|nr:hypothetical protein [Spinactinospora alkalitolerans]NYE46487.1 sarcosine oxidase subunit gamma [Spinactinospora alkalitolerans]
MNPSARAPLTRGAGPDAAVSVRELPPYAQVELRVDPEEAAPAARMAAEFLSCALPGPGRACGDGRPHVLWHGPGRYLVVDESATGRGLAIGLACALGGEYGAVCGSVVDVSARYAVLELCGPGAEGVLARDCAPPPRPRAFAPGRYAPTTLAGVRVGLHRPGPSPSYRVLVPADRAGHVLDRLLETARGRRS